MDMYRRLIDAAEPVDELQVLVTTQSGTSWWCARPRSDNARDCPACDESGAFPRAWLQDKCPNCGAEITDIRESPSARKRNRGKARMTAQRVVRNNPPPKPPPVPRVEPRKPRRIRFED